VNDPSGPRPAAPSHLLNAGSLACGADVDTLLEQIADGHASQLTDHQRDCVHCRAAIGELNALWSPVRELAAAPVPSPPGLATAVIGRIRRLARDVGYTLEMTDGGAIRIAGRIVAALARDSASRVPGVRLALGRTTHGPLRALAPGIMPADRRAGTAAGVLGRTAVVDLTIAVNYDRPVRHVARDIQKQVAAALRNDLGLRAATVNVVIGDILDPAGE
jgi:uncharacterized alkaline shock family protein YloU